MAAPDCGRTSLHEPREAAVGALVGRARGAVLLRVWKGAVLGVLAQPSALIPRWDGGSPGWRSHPTGGQHLSGRGGPLEEQVLLLLLLKE